MEQWEEILVDVTTHEDPLNVTECLEVLQRLLAFKELFQSGLGTELSSLWLRCMNQWLDHLISMGKPEIIDTLVCRTNPGVLSGRDDKRPRQESVLVRQPIEMTRGIADYLPVRDVLSLLQLCNRTEAMIRQKQRILFNSMFSEDAMKVVEGSSGSRIMSLLDTGNVMGYDHEWSQSIIKDYYDPKAKILNLANLIDDESYGDEPHKFRFIAPFWKSFATREYDKIEGIEWSKASIMDRAILLWRMAPSLRRVGTSHVFWDDEPEFEYCVLRGLRKLKVVDPESETSGLLAEHHTAMIALIGVGKVPPDATNIDVVDAETEYNLHYTTFFKPPFDDELQKAVADQKYEVYNQIIESVATFGPDTVAILVFQYKLGWEQVSTIFSSREDRPRPDFIQRVASIGLQDPEMLFKLLKEFATEDVEQLNFLYAQEELWTQELDHYLTILEKFPSTMWTKLWAYPEAVRVLVQNDFHNEFRQYGMEPLPMTVYHIPVRPSQHWLTAANMDRLRKRYTEMHMKTMGTGPRSQIVRNLASVVYTFVLSCDSTQLDFDLWMQPFFIKQSTALATFFGTSDPHSTGYIVPLSTASIILSQVRDDPKVKDLYLANMPIVQAYIQNATEHNLGFTTLCYAGKFMSGRVAISKIHKSLTFDGSLNWPIHRYVKYELFKPDGPLKELRQIFSFAVANVRPDPRDEGKKEVYFPLQPFSNAVIDDWIIRHIIYSFRYMDRFAVRSADKFLFFCLDIATSLFRNPAVAKKYVSLDQGDVLIFDYRTTGRLQDLISNMRHHLDMILVWLGNKDWIAQMSGEPRIRSAMDWYEWIRGKSMNSFLEGSEAEDELERSRERRTTNPLDGTATVGESKRPDNTEEKDDSTPLWIHTTSAWYKIFPSRSDIQMDTGTWYLTSHLVNHLKQPSSSSLPPHILAQLPLGRIDRPTLLLLEKEYRTIVPDNSQASRPGRERVFFEQVVPLYPNLFPNGIKPVTVRQLPV